MNSILGLTFRQKQINNDLRMKKTFQLATKILKCQVETYRFCIEKCAEREKNLQEILSIQQAETRAGIVSCSITPSSNGMHTFNHNKYCNS